MVMLAPVKSGDAAYPGVAGFTVFFPLVMHLAPHSEPEIRYYQRIQPTNQSIESDRGGPPSNFV